MKHHIGEEVICLQSFTKDKAYVIGEGTVASIEPAYEISEFNKTKKGAKLSRNEPISESSHLQNPNAETIRIKLLTGQYIYGTECIWGRRSVIKSLLSSRDIINIQPK